MIERADSSGLDELHAAIQTYSNGLADSSDDVGVVGQAITVWEETSYGENGVERQVLYTVSGDGWTTSGSLGLALHPAPHP